MAFLILPLLRLITEKAVETKMALREVIWASKRKETAFLGPSEESRITAAEKFQEEKKTLVGDTIFLSVRRGC